MNSSPPKILMVDDRPENLLALEVQFEGLEVEIFKATSGNDALKIAAKEELALILLDVQMPVMDGFETAEIMRAAEETRLTPIIFVTAINREEQYVFKGYGSGAVDYLFKPIDTIVLKSKVNVFLDLYRQRQTIERQATHLKKALDSERQISENLLQTSRELKLSQEQVEKSNRYLSEVNEQMVQDLEQARTTQRTLLPRKLPTFEGGRLATKYVPVDQIGGDFYDVLPLGSNKLGLLIADVSGHGIPAALLTFMISGLFKNIAKKEDSPATTFRKLNEALYKKLPLGKFVTAFYGIFDTVEHSLIYASAGHPPAFVVNPETKETMKLDSTTSLLGIFSTNKNSALEKKVQLSPKDRLFMYTDSLIEMKNEETGMFSQKRLKELLLENCHIAAEDLIELVYDTVLAYSGEYDFDDDTTMVVLQMD